MLFFIKARGRVILCILGALFLTACGQSMSGEKLARTGVNAKYTAKDVRKSALEQEEILTYLIWSALHPMNVREKDLTKMSESTLKKKIEQELKEIGPLPVDDKRWVKVYEAGKNLIDQSCMSYLDELEAFKRKTDSRLSIISDASTNAGIILGLSGVASKKMSIVAAAFGFSRNALEFDSKSVLYALEPSRVRGLVKKMQNAYKFPEKYINSKTRAVEAIQGYLEVCLPSKITAFVNSAVSAAKIKNKNKKGIPHLDITK